MVDSNNKEEEDMRKAFEQFMSSGKKKDSKSGSVQQEKSDEQGDGRMEAREEMVLKKAERKYWQILNAFQGTLERDWLQVDDNLEGVVSSISNLRRRIMMESRRLEKMTNKSVKRWHGCGYRMDDETSVGLTVDDVELALSHDLLQHEKMMAGARILLSSLSEAQEALGRRLDELMLHHLDTQYLIQSMSAETMPSLATVMSVVDELQSIFGSLALELYRKQLLIQSALDAVNDDLLVRGDDDEDVGDKGMDVNPRRLAEKCSRDWPRGCKASHVNVEMLNGLLQLGERGDRR